LDFSHEIGRQDGQGNRFLEFERETRLMRPVAERVRDFREIERALAPERLSARPAAAWTAAFRTATASAARCAT
jgi:hypothetical protein